MQHLEGYNVALTWILHEEIEKLVRFVFIRNKDIDIDIIKKSGYI